MQPQQPTDSASWKRWYAEVYLLSPEWKDRRDAVMRRARFICEGCLQREATQVHHRPEAYRQLRENGRELLCDLVALCDTCHEQVAHGEPRAAADPEPQASLTMPKTPFDVDVDRALERVLTAQAGTDSAALESAMREHHDLCAKRRAYLGRV